jgi:transposase
MARHGLTDREWTRLRPLLPPRAHTGRPPKDHRAIVDALLWLGKTGAPWRDLPERFGPWRTVATRFYRWTRSGLWDRLLAELVAAEMSFPVHPHMLRHACGFALAHGRSLVERSVSAVRPSANQEPDI